MYSYEIPKRIGYPKTVFYDDGVVFYYKDGREIGVKASDIERISYVKPSLLNYIGAVLSLMFCGTGEQPGRMEIYLHDSVNGSLHRQSQRYLLRFWRITVGALLCQSRSHVPQARASRLFLALLASNAPKLPCTRGRGISVRDKANERSCSLCTTASEFNAVSDGNTRPSGGANMLATA